LSLAFFASSGEVVFAPRLLELAGAGVLIYALGRYSDDENDYTLAEDFEDLKEETTRLVKKATGFDVDN
jgi:hypothetical protein